MERGAINKTDVICYGHYLVRTTEKALLRAMKSNLGVGRKGANNFHARALRELAGRAGTTHRLIGVRRQMLALHRQLVDAGDDDFSGVKFFNKELLS
jgi:hypothetical protein